MVKNIIGIVRIILYVWVIIEIIVANFSIFQWKSLYFCPEFGLYVYSDNGVVGNRSLLLGQDLKEMNTLLRFDHIGDDNCCYILKGEEQYLIYWPEDTASFHYEFVFNTQNNSYSQQIVPYHKRLKEVECRDGLFQLVTYKHQTKENWKEDFESWTDSTYWDKAANALVIDNVLCPTFADWKNGKRFEVQNISSSECGVITYMKLYWKALDKTMSGIILANIFGLCFLIWLSYRIGYNRDKK